jgi:hypothetical protein
VRCGHPSGSFLFRAVLGDRVAKQLILILRGAPATSYIELDPVVRGVTCSLAQGTKESWIKVGYSRNPVIEDRRAVRDGAVSLAKHTTVLTAKTTVLTAQTTGLTAKTTRLTAKDVDG